MILQAVGEVVAKASRPDTITQIGVGGIFAILIIDRVLAWALKYKNGKNGKDNPGIETAVATALGHPQIQGHLYGAIKSEERIIRIDGKTDELCKCLTAQTTIMGQVARTQEEQKDILADLARQRIWDGRERRTPE